MIKIDPEEIEFKNVSPSSIFETQITIKNNSQQQYQLSFKLYNKERYEILPTTFNLQPNQIQVATIKLRIGKTLNRLEMRDFLYLSNEQKGINNFEVKIPIKLIKQEQENENGVSIKIMDLNKVQSNEELLSSQSRELQLQQQNGLISLSSAEAKDSSKLNQLPYSHNLFQQDGCRQLQFNQIQSQQNLKLNSNLFQKSVEDRESTIYQKFETDQLDRPSALDTSRCEFIQIVKELLKDQPNIDEIVEQAIKQDRKEQEHYTKEIISQLNLKDQIIQEQQIQIQKSKVQLEQLSAELLKTQIQTSNQTNESAGQDKFNSLISQTNNSHLNKQKNINKDKEIELLQKSIEDLQRQRNQIEMNYFNLQRENEQLNKLLNDSEKQMQTKEKKYNEQLNNQLEQADEEIKRMKNQISNLLLAKAEQHEYMREEQIIIKLNQQVSELLNAEKKSNEESKYYKNQYQQLNQEYLDYKNSTQKELQQLNYQIQGLEDQKLIRKNDQQDLEIVKREKIELENKYAHHINSEKIMQKRIEILEKEKSQMSKNLQDYANLVERNDQQHNTIVQSLENQLQQLQTQNQQLQNTVKQNEQKPIINQNNQIEDQLNITATSQQMHELEEKLKIDLQKEIATIQQNCTAKIQEQASRIEQLNYANQILKEKEQTLVQEINTFLQTINDRDKMVQNVRIESKIQEKKVIQLTDENKKLQENNRRNTIEIERTKQEISKLLEQVQGDTKKRSKMEEKLQERVAILQNELNNAFESRQKMKQELNEELEKTTLRMEQNIKALREENKDLEKKYFFDLEERQREAKMWADKEQQFQTQNAVVEKKYSKLKKQYKKLKLELQSNNQDELDQNNSQKKDNKKIKRSDLEENLRVLESEAKYLKVKSIQDQQKIELLTQRLDGTIGQEDRLKDEIKQLNIKLLENEKAFEILQKQKDELFNKNKSLELIDEKIVLEVNGLRECMLKLGKERDRILEHVRQKEDDCTNNHEKYVSDLITFLKQTEGKYKALELETTAELQQKNNKITALETEQACIMRENQDLRQQVVQKDKNLAQIISDKSKFIQIQQNTQQQEFEQQIQLAQQNLQEEKLQVQNFAKEQQQKCDNIIQAMRDEMMAQNKIQKESQQISQYHIMLLKEKCMQDLNDLLQKFESYFINKKKQIGDLSYRKELPFFQKLFETYIDNVSQFCSKEALIKQKKEENRNLIQELEKVKLNLQKLQEKYKKICDENAIYQKKYYRTKKEIDQAINNNEKTDEDQNNYQQTNNNIYQMDNAVFEAQILTLKQNISIQQEEIDQLNQQKQNLEQTIEQNLNIQQEQNRMIESYQIQIKEMQENYNLELQKSSSQDRNETMNRIKESVNDLQNDLEEKDQIIKDLRDELYKRKDAIQNLRLAKEDRESRLNNANQEINILKEEIEKIKRSQKEASRKEENFKDLREKLEQIRNNEKLLIEEKQVLLEKIKNQKQDLQRKEILLNNEKEKQIKNQDQAEKISQLEEEIERQKEHIKRLKSDLDCRTNIQATLKQKNEFLQQEIEELKNQIQQNNQQKQIIQQSPNKQEFEKKLQKNNETKQQNQNSIQLTSKKIENQNQMLLFIIKRLFRESLVNVQKLRNKIPANQSVNEIYQTNAKNQNNNNISNYNQQIQTASQSRSSKFVESMNILNLQQEELDQFINASERRDKSYFTHSLLSSQQLNELSQRFEEEINAKQENLNLNNIYNMINSLIDERIDLEKNII